MVLHDVKPNGAQCMCRCADSATGHLEFNTFCLKFEFANSSGWNLEGTRCTCTT